MIGKLQLCKNEYGSDMLLSRGVHLDIKHVSQSLKSRRKDLKTFYHKEMVAIWGDKYI